jgi:threonine dehydratase
MLRDPSITRERIAETNELIRPYVRRTPMVRVDASDFGISAPPLALKLEFLQHSARSRRAAPSPIC